MTIVIDDGHAVAGCEYEPFGGIISPITELPKNSHFRHHSYIHDQETDLYYLQSCYYDPGMGRFINADAFASTGQGILGNNMFAYCANNPSGHIDPDGLRFIGFGFQFELQIGDIAVGVEVVIYTDPQVCGNKDYLIVAYTYSGYELSIGDLQKVSDIAEALVTTAVFEANNPDVEAWYSAVTYVLSGVGLSGGAFILFGNKDFKSPKSYSGGFETWSASASVKSTTVTGFHSYSSNCDAYGFKFGAHADGLRSKSKNIFGVSYSRSRYSKPYVLLEAT